ncbi:MAG: dihydroxyacetone kinase subunit L [Anaerolineales bacterium]|nr:dihydroxyacetone kinase subunit L [Anaerolineales bacterium]
MPQNLDLGSLFQAVTRNLLENQNVLNQADTYNHDHGDNMVQIFKMITEAMETKQGADPADQLAYASELLRQRSRSGSAKMYADGLSQASQQFQGKNVTPDNVLTLIQTLLGTQQAQSPQQPLPSGNVLDTLISSFTGGQQDTGQNPININDILTAGMAFLNNKQQGKDNLESLVNALVTTTQAGQTPHRAQSATLVANTMLQMLGSLNNKSGSRS